MLPACQRGNPDYFGTIRPKHGPDELWLNNGNEPEWLDPGRLADSAGSALIFNVMSGLVQIHPESLQPMPDLASRWEISDDGRVYTFTLRDGITWSDGRLLTAEDFVWSWRRVVDPKTGSRYASFLYVLQNAEPINQRALWVEAESPNDSPVDWERLVPVIGGADVGGVETTSWPRPGAFVYVARTHPTEDRKLDAEELQQARERLIRVLESGDFEGVKVRARISDPSLLGVEAPDEHTVVATLKDPVPYFLSQLSFYTFLPVPRHVLVGLEERGVAPELWTNPEHIVSSGPYLLTEHKFRQYYIFEKNPYYWDAESTRLLRVKALLIDSYATGLNMYRAGEIDWTGTNASLPSHFMDHLEGFKDFRRDPKLSVYMFWLNVDDPALRDVRVRKALSLSIDRASLVKNVTRAGQLPTADLVPDGLNHYEGLGLETFNPKKARELLDAARADAGGELPPLTLIYNTSEGHKKIAEAVQQMWKDHLGIEVQLANQEWKVFLKTRNLMDFQIARGGWVGDYPDPYTYLDLLSSTNGNNSSNWASAKYDDLLARANANPDPEARLALLREAESHMLDAQPVIPVYVYTKSQMIKPYVKGFWGNYQDRHPWKYMYIDPDWASSPESEAPPEMIPFD